MGVPLKLKVYGEYDDVYDTLIQLRRIFHCRSSPIIDARAQKIELFDGYNWRCVKCGNKFNILEVDNYRCPECRTQVKKRDLLNTPFDLPCTFQTPRFTPDYRGLGCELKGIGIGAGGSTGDIELFSPCPLSRCPRYQTWKLLQKQREE